MMKPLQIILSILGIAVIAYVSRRSLRQPGSHGFYRFFAWAAILILAIINLPRWLANPFAPYQLVSWLLLIASPIPLILGVSLLRKRGESRGEVAGSANYAFENTTRLVTWGVYRYIRHPLYASLLYLTWGIYAKEPWSVVGLALAAIATVFLFLTARKEEQENIRTFGAEYEAYMKRTRRFIPFIL